MVHISCFFLVGVRVRLVVIFARNEDSFIP